MHQLEVCANKPRRATFQAIRRALEMARVEFIDENGGSPRRAATKAAPEEELGPRWLGTATQKVQIVFHPRK